MLRNSKGFTLIELMIVVVIIGILAAIAIPNFISMQDRAREGSVKANMHTAQLAMEDFAVQNDGVYATAEADALPSGDTVQTLCMVAAVAKTPTTITGIGHLKFKESDRITGTAERLRALGGHVDVGNDYLTITPAPLHGGTIDPANDHRTAMSFGVLGLGTGGITIMDAGCVNKSFPGFWDMLKRAGVQV